MSVIMVQWVKGDPHGLPRTPRWGSPEGTRNRAKAKDTLIAHRFYGSEGAPHCDEWPDEESFGRLRGARSRIEPMLKRLV